jgi:hypothetical protein
MRWLHLPGPVAPLRAARSAAFAASALTRDPAAQRLAEDLRDQIVGRAARELGEDRERSVGRERRQRIDLEEVRAARGVEPEVGAREVAALERREREQREPCELALERASSAPGVCRASRPRCGMALEPRAARSRCSARARAGAPGSARGGACPTTATVYSAPGRKRSTSAGCS